MKGILLDSNYEPVIKGTAVQIGDTDTQNCELVIMAEKGEFKEHPALGAGLLRWIKSTGKIQDIRREISIQLGYIGYEGAKIDINGNGKLTVEL
jgi:hypothetical protein